MADSSSSEENKSSGDIGVYEEQRSKQVKFSLNFLFQSGRINLIDVQGHKVELYQDDLTVALDFRRDTSFEIAIGNRNVGINIIDAHTHTIKELIVKHIHEEEKKEASELLQWQLKVVKSGTIENGFVTDIIFESVRQYFLFYRIQ